MTTSPPATSWEWWAVVGTERTKANPYSVFRRNRETIEQWKGSLGWVYTPSLLRYVYGEDTGAEPITRADADKLTGGNANARSP